MLHGVRKVVLIGNTSEGGGGPAPYESIQYAVGTRSGQINTTETRQYMTANGQIQET
jgi:hypothetical protein